MPGRTMSKVPGQRGREGETKIKEKSQPSGSVTLSRAGPGESRRRGKLGPPWLPVPPVRGPAGAAVAAPSSPAPGQPPGSPRAPAPPPWRCSAAPGRGRINTRERESAGFS